MTDFDDFDDRFLADMLNAASGTHPDETAAYGAVMGRVRTVRRRRAAIVSGATAAVMMIGVSVLALRAGTDGRSLEPASTGPDGAPISTVAPDPTDPDATSPDGDDPADTSSPESSPDDSSVDDSTPDDSDPNDSTPDDSDPNDSEPNDSDPDEDDPDGSSTNTTAPGAQPGTTPGTTTAPTTPSVPATNTPTTPPTTRPPTTQPPTTQPPTTAPPTTAPPTTAPPTTAPMITRTFSCLGGSATVRLSSGVLTLLGSSAAAGFELDTSEARPDRVRVRWESDNATSQLEVRPAGGSMTSSCDDEVEEDEDEDEPSDDE